MDDLGPPTSHIALEEGVDVLGRDGKPVGKVQHVLSDEESGIFDGIVIDTQLGPGGLRFADAPEVAEIHERGVVLTIDSGAVGDLPKPSASPAVMEHGGAEDSESPLHRKLRRAWDLISGNY